MKYGHRDVRKRSTFRSRDRSRKATSFMRRAARHNHITGSAAAAQIPTIKAARQAVKAEVARRSRAKGSVTGTPAGLVQADVDGSNG